MADSSSSGGDPGEASERLDALFTALADERQRQVLCYFQTAEKDVASVEELIDNAIEEGTGDLTKDELEVAFHHTVLPKLANLGVIEYDTRSQMVRYRSSPGLERAFTALAEADLIPEYGKH